MSIRLRLHPDNPQLRFLNQAVECLRKGGVIVYPTDCAYAFGCQVGEKGALERIQTLRQVDKNHNFTLVCRDLSEISTYARIDNASYRLLKAYTPGPYTFVLPATSDVPRLVQHPKRKTIGLRIPAHPVVQALLTLSDAPILSSSLIFPSREDPLFDPDDIEEFLGKQIDMLLDSGYCGRSVTSVIDLVDGVPMILREGSGDTSMFR
jgi:tRNA threonylcarbamoyl adenosine modification protein (Sua5/YciO/YrdC/YwlC family)